ncbi:hypothetical protein [Sulfurimonas sp.]
MYLSLFDDIATLLDDAATMSKIDAKKTAGISGDGKIIEDFVKVF